MDFAETEEQSMIREMVRDFAEEVLAPTCLDRDRNQKPPLDEWEKFCEYGLQGITIPEEYGGNPCLLYTSPSPRDISGSRMPSSA